MRFCEAWKACLPYLKPAIERLHGTHLVEDVLHGILDLELHLWSFSSGVAITEFVPYPRLMSCNVFLVGGKLDEVLPWCAPDGPLEKWAIEQGCQMVETTSRPGLSRRTPGHVLTRIVRRLGDG